MAFSALEIGTPSTVAEPARGAVTAFDDGLSRLPFERGLFMGFSFGPLSVEAAGDGISATTSRAGLSWRSPLKAA